MIIKGNDGVNRSKTTGTIIDPSAVKMLTGTVLGATSAFLAPLIAELATVHKPAYKLTLRNMFNNVTLLTYSLYNVPINFFSLALVIAKRNSWFSVT